MPHMLGTELAREILGHSENTDIIFLTTSSDYAVDAFSIHAADYIQKPYTREKFEASLDRVIALRQERTWLLLPSEGELHRIALEDVLYIETDDKRRIFSLASGKKLAARMSAAQLQDCLSGRRGMVVWGVLCGQSQPCPLFFRHGSGYGHRRAHPCPPAAAGADQTGIF